jgi:hypothetical protein
MAKTNLTDSANVTSMNPQGSANLAQRFASLREELAAERFLQEQKEKIEMELSAAFETQKIVSELQQKLQKRIDPWAMDLGCYFSVPSYIADMIAEKLTAETGLRCSVRRNIMDSMLTIHAP